MPATSYDDDDSDRESGELQSESGENPLLPPDSGAAGPEQSRPAKREAAKSAIRQLHEHNVGYKDLIKEAINADLLGQLYEELNIHPHYRDAINSGTIMATAQSSKLPKPSATNSVLAPSPHLVQTSPENERERQVSQTQVAPKSQTPSTLQAAPPLLRKPNSDALAGKPLDRKDYIAKLLAAKQSVKQRPNGSNDNITTSKSPTLQEPTATEFNQASPSSMAPAHNRIDEGLSKIESRDAPSTSVTDGRRLYIGNLAFATTEKDLSDFFEEFLVESITVPKLPNSGRSVGYAFVDLSTATEAQRAISELSGDELLSRRVHVQLARSPGSGNEENRVDSKNQTQTKLVRQRLEALKSGGPNTNSSIPLDDLDALNDPATSPAANTTMALPATRRKEAISLSAQHDLEAKLHRQSETQGSPNTPDASFFAIGNVNSFGGLPGLITPNLVTSHTQSKHQVAASSNQRIDVAVKPTLSEDASTSTQSSVRQATPSDSSVSTRPALEQSGRLESTENLPVTETRKRAIAADFLDPPVPFNKRRMMAQDPISLVIEVSDDEDGDTRKSLSSTPAHQPAFAQSDLNPKGLRDGPTLSDFPMKRSPNSNVNTPPTSQNHKGLAQTEEEIRLLQLKIAAMEQRKKEKVSTRHLPPGAPSDKVDVSSSTAKVLIDKHQALEQGESELVVKRESLAAAQTLVEGNLQTDQKNQALIVAKAEAEARAAERATDRTQREARLQRKRQLEAVLPKLNAQIDVAQDRLAQVIKQQEEIQAEIRRGDAGRQALLAELDSISDLLVEGLDAMAEEVQPELGPPPAAQVPPLSLGKPLYASRRFGTIPLTQCVDAAAEGNVNGDVDPQPNRSGWREPSVVTSDSSRKSESPGETAAPEVPPNRRASDAVEAMDISSSSPDDGQIVASQKSPIDSPRPSSNTGKESEGEYEPPAAYTAVDPSTIEEAMVTDYPPRADSSSNEYGDTMDVEDEAYSPAPPPERGQSAPSEAPVLDPLHALQPGVEASNDGPSHRDEDVSVLRPSLAQASPSGSSQEEGEIDEGPDEGDDYEPPEPSPPVDDIPAATSLHSKTLDVDHQAPEQRMSSGSPLKVNGATSNSPASQHDNEPQLSQDQHGHSQAEVVRSFAVVSDSC